MKTIDRFRYQLAKAIEYKTTAVNCYAREEAQRHYDKAVHGLKMCGVQLPDSADAIARWAAIGNLAMIKHTATGLLKDLTRLKRYGFPDDDRQMIADACDETSNDLKQLIKLIG